MTRLRLVDNNIMVVEGAGEPNNYYTLDLLTIGPQSVAIEFAELAEKKNAKD